MDLYTQTLEALNAQSGQPEDLPTAPANPNEMDRPCDVCVGLDGRVYVVDFGNNMIRVF